MTNNSPFWTAYNSAVKQHLLPLVEPPKDNEVFALPFTVPFTSATGRLTDEGFNYLLYNLANTTLANDGRKASYDSELNTYLNTVDESSLQDPTAKKRLDDAEEKLKDAKANFDKVDQEARVAYQNWPDPKPPYEQWVVQNYPPYNTALRDKKSAQTERDTAYNAYWGRINTLRQYQDNLQKALDTKALHQSYNMSVQNGGDSTFRAYYSSFGFKDQLNTWIEGGGQEEVFFEVKIDSATPPSSVKADGGIYLKLTTKGVQKFDLHVGQWDVPGVKTLYPKRVSGAADVLDPKYARPISVLVAYGPKLEVEIREEDGGLNSTASSVPAQDDQPYVAVLGILGQHFPEK